MYYIAKIKDKDLYLNQTTFGLSGGETSYYFISKTPMLFDGRSDLKETLEYFKSGFGKIINDIDDSDINDLVIKRVDLVIK
jgi:hypothetical protein